MFKIELPRGEPKMSLREGLELLRQHQRRALICDLDGKNVLLHVGDILSHLRKHGNLRLEELPSGISTPTLSAKMTADAARVAAAREGYLPDSEFPSLRTAFSSKRLDYFVVKPTRPAVQVITASETLAAALSRKLVLCACRADQDHQWEPDELDEAGKCSIDGEPVDCS